MTFIALEAVSVEFPVFNMGGRSLKKQLLQVATGGVLRQARDSGTVYVKALDNITLRLERGDRVGVLGHNGAGKSTLMRVLARIHEPTQGSFSCSGKISPLLNVMLGINPESTGYENIMLRGMLLGLTRKEILAKMDEIATFTELGDYLHIPIRTYSSGMLMRLAFAIATSIEPEILLLDEVIGAFDRAFLTKAKEKLNDLVAKSSIVVLATHMDDLILDICNKAILLQHGSLVYVGDVKSAMQMRDSLLCKELEDVAVN